MRLPALQEIPTTRDFIDKFGGYNHNVRIGENEFYDMKNLTSSHYPVLATRNKRGTYLTQGDFYYKKQEVPVGMVDKDGLCIVTLSLPLNRNYTLQLYAPNRENHIHLGYTELGPEVKRTVVSMGAYIVIFPDNVYINMADITDKGSFENEWIKSSTATAAAFFQPYTKDGDSVIIRAWFDKTIQPDFLNDYIHKDVTRGPVNHAYVAETNTGDLYYWLPSGDSGAWFTDRAYLGIYASGEEFESKFKVGDGLRIDGFDTETEDDATILKDLFNDDIKRPFNVISVSENNIVFDYNLANFIKSADYKTNSAIRLNKNFPIMDYVIESGNRLWGCRYGVNRFGDIVNEIYASKLGDFSNWETFSGISTDSYAASVGSPGPFTGAISYLGNPLFFKQDCIHAVYGNYPATYQIQTTECKGVQRGCADSLAIVGGTLLYKSVRGVSAYTGSLPTDIGYALNEQKLSYKDAFASEYKGKYYLAMVDETNNRQLFVYDLDKGVWHKEGEFDGVSFCLASWNGFDALYYRVVETYLDGDVEFSDSTIKVIEGYGEHTDDEKIGWMAETGVLGCSSPDKKYISRISIRLSIGIGTRVYVYAEYDSSGTWEQLGAITGTSLNTFTFPVRPKRCDHLRLKIEGTDEARIYSISKTYEQGSDI